MPCLRSAHEAHHAAAPGAPFPALLPAATSLLLPLGPAGLAAPPAFTPVPAQVSAVAEDAAQIAGLRASAAEDINPAAQTVDGDLSTRWSGPLPVEQARS